MADLKECIIFYFYTLIVVRYRNNGSGQTQSVPEDLQKSD